ncbi:MAG: hypothetical protein DMF72_02500 [Acidobacteria bacterium]|nr:MAG: hypothetical protein DMF72_02500 [Acidobacteriota bacterium]
MDRRPGAFGHVKTSRVLSVLGPEWFAEFSAVNIPGKVIWCNFELARELGFDVPRSNLMTPEFHAQIIAALSYRILERDEVVAEPKTITMYADRYGGVGVSPALGSGRAGFLPYGNLCIKGLGLTPLFKHDDPDDFEHSHGGLPMDEALAESLFGEVNMNLFTLGSARLLAIIDNDEFITYPEGHKVPRVLAARAGRQLRPGHLLAKRIRRRGARLETFLRMTRETGQLVMQQRAGASKLPDIKATMRRIIDDHARTSAEQLRWRMIHGALTSSNMEISGAMLDLPTQSTQPRTAPIYVLPYPDSTFGREHFERAVQLRPMYTALVRDVPPAQRDSLNIKSINLRGEMDQAYQKHLQVMLLAAAGLKTEVAEFVQANDADLARRFAAVVLKMARMKNWGKLNIGARPVATVSVLDIFHLFQVFPGIHFAAPRGNHAAKIRASLKPVLKGNRFQVSRKQAMIESLIKEFGDIYRELMNACDSLAARFYGSRKTMRESITARAAFENEPITALFRMSMYKELEQAVDAYKVSGDARICREVIDRKVTASLRSVDRLLTQGTSRRLSDGGFELQRRTIDGVNYSVKAWNTRRQPRRVHVSLTVVRDGQTYLTSLPGRPCLSAGEVKSLRYSFTIDGWLTCREARASLMQDQDQLTVNFQGIASFPRIGRLAGIFYIKGGRRLCTKGGLRALGEYPFAIPDQMELMQSTNA